MVEEKVRSLVCQGVSEFIGGIRSIEEHDAMALCRDQARTQVTV
jgi:hypothetical protein